MKRLVDILCWFVIAAAVVVSFWQVSVFLTFKDARGLPDMASGISHLWLSLGAAAVAVAGVVFFFVRHPHHEEEIHITK